MPSLYDCKVEMMISWDFYTILFSMYIDINIGILTQISVFNGLFFFFFFFLQWLSRMLSIRKEIQWRYVVGLGKGMSVTS